MQLCLGGVERGERWTLARKTLSPALQRPRNSMSILEVEVGSVGVDDGL
jgi:hypothetical protein